MKSPIIIALDMGPEVAIELAEKIDPTDCKVKVGSQLFTTGGPAVIEKLKDLGFDIFLDLKFHDIPNTVKKSVEATVDMGIWMLNIHSLGGREMLSSAQEVVRNASTKPLLIGVTILTSLNNEAINQVGLHRSTEDQVLLLAQLCEKEGLDGVVCSPKELLILREHLPKDFLLVTPGIRSTEVKKDDQKRISTAKEAIKNGANYIVIGREVTNDLDPSKKIGQMLKTFLSLEENN